MFGDIGQLLPSRQRGTTKGCDVAGPMVVLIMTVWKSARRKPCNTDAGGVELVVDARLYNNRAKTGKVAIETAKKPPHIGNGIVLILYLFDERH